jgi:hypothetical protein
MKLVKHQTEKPGDEGFNFSIRHWKDQKGIDFYDCSCEGRIPSSFSSITTTVRDIVTMRKHLELHMKRHFVCGYCHFVCRYNYLKINEHNKIHKMERILNC